MNGKDYFMNQYNGWTEPEKQAELEKLIREQARDAKNYQALPQRVSRNCIIYPVDPRELDKLPVEARLNSEGNEELAQPGQQVETTEYDRQCAEKWQIAINKAKQQIKRPED